VGSTHPAPATFYRPAEVAAMLRCSEWWVKEQARKRRIPYSWIGGSYLFTTEHITEIIRVFEVRPVESATPVNAPKPASCRLVNGAPPTVLRARTPRRARDAAVSNALAA
jgi:hypothetical protein